jgi:hypothetical protein
MPTNSLIVHVHPSASAARTDAANAVAGGMMLIHMGEVKVRVAWDNEVNRREDVARHTPARPMWVVIAHS